MPPYGWLGTTNSDHAIAANWDPATGPPGSGDDATFGAAGDPNPCTVTANWALANLTTDVGYTAKLDLNGHDLTNSGNITLGQAGEFDRGTGTISLDGDFNCVGIGAFTASTGDMVLAGLSDQDVDSGDNAIGDLQIAKAASGDVTLDDCDLELTAVAMAGNLTVTGSTLTASSDAKTINGDVDWSDAGNDISCGAGTVWTIGGDFDFSAIGMLTRQTATFVLTGNVPNVLAGAGSKAVYSLTFDTGSSYEITQIASVQSGLLLMRSGVTVDIATGRNLLGAAVEIQIQSGVVISRTGTGYFRLFTANLTQQDGEISAECRVQANSSLVGGNYSGLLWFLETSPNNRTMTVTGAFTVGSLEFETTSSGNITIDATGLTGMTVAGNLTVDLNSTGDITVNNTGNSAAWIFNGDVIDEWNRPGGGTFTWTKGSSAASITASGGNAQDWDWMGQTIEAIVVDKSAGTLTFSGGWTADSYTQTLGGVDFNGQALATTGNWTINGGTVADPAGAAITVGGDLAIADVDMVGTASWTLNVTGLARMRRLTVAYCDASAGSIVIAYGCIDGGNNSANILFQKVIGSRFNLAGTDDTRLALRGSR